MIKWPVVALDWIPRIWLSVLVSVFISMALLWSATGFAIAKTTQLQPPRAPQPKLVASRKGPLPADLTSVLEFETAPFPFKGVVPTTGRPFLDVTGPDGRLGHTTPYGHVLWQDEAYNDRRVLLHIPKGFQLRKPALMIVFFHGHGATIERDVLDRQRVAEQLTASGLNAVLVAPELAADAADSSPGKFWIKGAFGQFTGEAAQALATMMSDKKAVRTFASLPVVIVGYSGGFMPAAWSVAKGGLGKRVKGVVLFDALYGELAKFQDWITSNRSGFFVSAYLDGTRSRNEELQRSLSEQGIAIDNNLDGALQKGSVVFLPVERGYSHRDLMTNAWVESPLQDVLARIARFAR